jgi:hypothetical protein
MSATANIPAPKLADAKEVFCELCETRAFLWAHYQIELQDAVDELQAIAMRTGLVAALGQDAVQALMSEPFALVRASLDEEEPLEAANALEYDLMEYDLEAIARRVQRWELADPRDAWRHTGEPQPNTSIAPKSIPRPYRTPDTVVDAFKYVMSLGDADYLARWLASHPADAAALLKTLDGDK